MRTIPISWWFWFPSLVDKIISLADFRLISPVVSWLNPHSFWGPQFFSDASQVWCLAVLPTTTRPSSIWTGVQQTIGPLGMFFYWEDQTWPLGTTGQDWSCLVMGDDIMKDQDAVNGGSRSYGDGSKFTDSKRWSFIILYKELAVAYTIHSVGKIQEFRGFRQQKQGNPHELQSAILQREVTFAPKIAVDTMTTTAHLGSTTNTSWALKTGSSLEIPKGWAFPLVQNDQKWSAPNSWIVFGCLS